jgi:hypothetical protein
MDFVLMIVVALAAATAGLAGVYLGMKIDGRRRRNWTLDGDDNAKLPELLKAAAVFAAGIRPRIMYLDAIYSLVIGFVGAILFVLVDKYEPDGPLARLLKFLVLFVSMVAILHRLRPYGLALF